MPDTGRAAREATRAALDAIERWNPSTKAMLTVTADQALATAADIDARQSRGEWCGLLAGMTMSIKDNVDVAGVVPRPVLKCVPAPLQTVMRPLCIASSKLVRRSSARPTCTSGCLDPRARAHITVPCAILGTQTEFQEDQAAARAHPWRPACALARSAPTLADRIRIPAAFCGVARTEAVDGPKFPARGRCRYRLGSTPSVPWPGGCRMSPASSP